MVSLTFVSAANLSSLLAFFFSAANSLIRFKCANCFSVAFFLTFFFGEGGGVGSASASLSSNTSGSSCSSSSGSSVLINCCISDIFTLLVFFGIALTVVSLDGALIKISALSVEVSVRSTCSIVTSIFSVGSSLTSSNTGSKSIILY